MKALASGIARGVSRDARFCVGFAKPDNSPKFFVPGDQKGAAAPPIAIGSRTRRPWIASNPVLFECSPWPHSCWWKPPRSDVLDTRKRSVELGEDQACDRVELLNVGGTSDIETSSRYSASRR